MLIRIIIIWHNRCCKVCIKNGLVPDTVQADRNYVVEIFPVKKKGRFLPEEKIMEPEKTMKRIGEILSETCNLTQDVIAQALQLQRSNGRRIGDILVGQNVIREPDLHHALSIQSRMKDYELDEKGTWMSSIPVWLKMFVSGTVAVLGIWFLSSLLIYIANV